MAGLPVPNVRLADRVFAGGVHGAVGKESDSLVVPAIHKVVHSIASRANQVPKIFSDQDGIQPRPFARALYGCPYLGWGVNQG